MSATAAAPSPAATEVDQWLARFGEALEQGDAAGAADLFAAESYWRDLVAFTWNIKTVEGRDGVRDMLEHTLGATARLSATEGPRPPTGYRGLAPLRDAGGPRPGHLRLIDGQAWTLLTALESSRATSRARAAPAEGRRARGEPDGTRGSRIASARPRSSAIDAAICGDRRRRPGRDRARGAPAPVASADDHRRTQPASWRLVAQPVQVVCASTTRSGTTTCRTSSFRRTGRCSRPRTRSPTGWRCTRA